MKQSFEASELEIITFGEIRDVIMTSGCTGDGGGGGGCGVATDPGAEENIY